MARTDFSDAEIASHLDFNAIGTQAQSATDGVWLDAIGYPSHWQAFTVTPKSAQIVTVSAGRYVHGAVVYEQGAPTEINLQLHIPVAPSDQRWVALLLRGEELTINANRSFETSDDPETKVTVQRNTPKTIERRVNLIQQAGVANPIPAKPIIAETDACIAFVLLGATGVISIEPSNDHRVKTLYEVEGRVTAIEVNLEQLFLRTQTIETDVSNIASRLDAIPGPAVMRQIMRDVGATRRQLMLPDEQRAYVFDAGLTYDIWDDQHANWNARVREGIRFGYAHERISQLQLVNEDDPNIVIGPDRRMMPAYNEVVRISNTGGTSTVNISQQVHTVVTATKRTVSRTAIRYGTVKKVCTNDRYWNEATAGVRIGQMFKLQGKEYQLVTSKGGVSGTINSKWRYIRQVIRESWTETYWDYSTTQVGVNGSVYGQTFLNSQPMVAVGIDINIATVGTSGDIHLFVCETSASGQPIFSEILANATIARANLKTGWNRFRLPFTLLDAGKRYAFFTVTTGNHVVRETVGNNFTGGSRFYCTDGIWAMGDPDRDFEFRVIGARFDAARTVVNFDNLSLENGMTDIEFVMSCWEPGATALEWEIRPSGAAEWTTLEEHPDLGTHPLIGLPALVELRLVMMGTADLQPMIVLDSDLEARTGRHRGTMTAVSRPVALGVSSDSLVTQFTVDAFDADEHTVTPAIMVGSTTINPDVTEIWIDPAEPERRRFTSFYELSAPTTSVRMKPSMTAANVVNVPFIEDCFIAAL